jgi:hypothetical protein
MSRLAVHVPKPLGTLARCVITAASVILLPPFIVLAVAPMVLMLLPVAFIAMPFMLSAFAPAAVTSCSKLHGTDREPRSLVKTEVAT